MTIRCLELSLPWVKTIGKRYVWYPTNRLKRSGLTAQKVIKSRLATAL